MFTTIFDQKEKLWSGSSRVPLYNINLSVGQAILHSLESNPNKIGQVILIVNKGVSLTHAAILENLTKFMTLVQDNVMFCFSSLYWLSGFGTLISTTLYGATRIITTESYIPELFFYIVEKYKVTVALLTPSYVALLLQSDRLCQSSLSSLKLCWCGGSYVAEQLTKEMNKYLINGTTQVAYGLTEIAGILSANDTRRKLNSVGKLAFNIKLKLIDDNGKNCGVNETGEICCMPFYPFLGYFGDEQNTKQILDDDGWLHTGDMGFFDAEGYLYIVDRKKDILKYMSYQISPSEIETIILNCDGVSNVCVVGIPDLVKTDLPAAVIVRKRFGHKVTSEQIKNAVKGNCSDFKQLRGGVYFVDYLLAYDTVGKSCKAEGKSHRNRTI